MIKSSSPIRTMCVAACAVLAVCGQAQAQAVSEARVAELVAKAKAQVQAQAQQKASVPKTPGASMDLTMADAVKRALDSNLDLSAERMNAALQDLSIAEVLGAYRPTVTSTMGDNWARAQATSQLSGGQNVVTRNYLFNGGVSQLLPWMGGTAGLTWNNSRQDSTSNNVVINPMWKTALTATLAQPLLRNLWIDSTRESLQVAKISRANADVTLRARLVNTIANTKNAYWDLVYAVQAVDAARTSLELAQKLVTDNQARVEIGTLAPLDVVSAQAEAATRQQTLVTAQANRRTAELSLKRLIVGGTQDQIWTITLNPVDRPPTEASEKVDLEGALRKALERRTDLVLARNNLESNDVSIRYLRNQMLPGLDLAASYASSGLGGPYLHRNASLGGQITSVDPGGYSDALSYLRKDDFPSWSVAVTVSYPIGQSAAKASYAYAKVQYSQAQQQLKALELTVATDVTNAVLSVQSAFEQVQTAAAARTLSLKRLEAEQSKFEVGMSTNYNVVLAQRDYVDAQNSELQATLAYRKALVDLDRKQETAAQ